MSERLRHLLGSRALWFVLVALNLLLVAIAGYKTYGMNGVDGLSYAALADGILAGHYSQWLEFCPPIPDTFRTPGYPLYIAGFKWLTPAWKPLMAGTQVLMYIAGVTLLLRISDRWGGGREAQNILLLLLLPSYNIVQGLFVTTPEIPVLFCMAVVLHTDVFHPRPNIWRSIGIGLLLGFVFQCRPVYMLYPFARAAMGWLAAKRNFPWLAQGITLVTFLITLVPFAIWNKEHHGVLSPTPIEGGSAVFNLGYWCGRIPGYPKERAFENFIADELIRFVPDEKLAEERKAYEAEWDRIEGTVAHLLTERDSAMIERIAGRPSICYSYNSAYVIARERAIRSATFEDIGEHPGYYACFKAYTAVRLWVVGIDRGKWATSSPAGRLGGVAALLFTLTVFLMFIVGLLRMRWKQHALFTQAWPAALWVIYTGLIHVPFVIQTRYTSSVRPMLFLIIAVGIAWHWRQQRYTPTDRREP